MTAFTTTADRWTAHCAKVLLDLDGTLVDSTAAVLRGWRAWARQAKTPVDRLESIVHGRSAAETISILLPGIARDELLAHVGEVLRLQEVDPAPARPMPGAAALVEAIGLDRWAVVTGCSIGMATARLAAGGLPRPALLVTDEDVDAGKPHPDGYLLALRRLGVTPAETIAVEDAPAGVAAARAAGIRTVAVALTHPVSALGEADVVVAGLDRIVVRPDGDGLIVTAHDRLRP